MKLFISNLYVNHIISLLICLAYKVTICQRITTLPPSTKQLQFLRNEYTHKKEEQAATYDVVGARPSCIWKARWSVVSLRENQSFSKWMLKHRLICTYLLQQHMTRLCRYREVVSEMLQKNQKMAYVQKLYNSVYMHMRCCSEDLRYVTLKMLGNASKNFYLRKNFRFFFSDANFFWLFFDFCFTFLNQILTFYRLFTYIYNMNIRYFLDFLERFYE